MAKSKKRHRQRKKSQPVTQDLKLRSEKPATSKSQRELISKLHVALKELEKVKSDPLIQASTKTVRIQQLNQKICKLGGIGAYQQSSLLGERIHGNVNTSNWVLEKLKEFNIRAEKGSKLRLLDVGALHLNYTKHSKWLDVEAIDLNPQCEGIVKRDFFDHKVGQSGIYNIIVLSLVLNFISTPARRGEMLRRCEQLCTNGGMVFVVLPKACLENSRYLDHNLLQQIMEGLNFDLTCEHSSKKLSYKMFTKATRRKGSPAMVKAAFVKKEVRNGKKCNNFCIVLK